VRALATLLLISTAVLGAAQGLVDEIKSRGELVIATDATYPPFETKQGDEIVGFDVAVAQALAEKLGVKLRWIDTEWAGVLGSLESGKADLVLAGVTITAERKEKGYLFSRPYFLSGQIIVRRKGDSRIQKPKDLLDKIVSVQQQTTSQFALEKLGLPAKQMLRFDQVQDALLDLRNGKADATVADLPTVAAFLKQSYPELEIIGDPFVKENLGIVAWKSNPELMSVVNQSLGEMMVDGRYASWYKKYFDEPLTTADLAEFEEQKKDGSKVPELTSAPKKQQTGPKVGSSFTFRWDILDESIPLLARGAVLTLELTALSLFLGVIAGLFIALLRVSPLVIFRPFMIAYVEVVRGTPLLMQIYVIYFVLPAIGIELNAFVAGVLALSLNAAAYVAEIFRAGIQSIDSGQMEAARSLGMTYPMAMRWVILPQTVRRVLPPLTNEAVALLKDSSLVSVVALAELMRVGKEIATNSGSPTTVFLTVALFYLAMTLPLTWLVRQLERKWSLSGRGAI
jgi:His/Glu/Gln/Arg/opine family amino acid ABC transporter permease subunit